jgi:hypothetical protein
MSGYQYYEFCSINKPLTHQARSEMRGLSKRSRITTHGASYVYNYGSFHAKPKDLLLKYFDVFFYISNWGTLQLMFRYKKDDVDIARIKTYLLKNVISCETKDEYVVLNIELNDENGGSGNWLEGEELFPDLLPLYDEIKNGNYQLLLLASLINAKYNEQEQTTIELEQLSMAQKSLIKAIDFSIEN